MLDSQLPPLGIARKILNKETIEEIRSVEGITNSAYLILDRWALNSPEKLLELEAKGIFLFMERLDQQRTLENEALDSETGYDMALAGKSQWEIFEALEVNTEL